jgi:hypothetical protein
MNSEQHEAISEQVQAAQALLDPEQVARRIRLLAAQTTMTQGADAAPDVVDPAIKLGYLRAKNKADKTVKSGQYVRQAEELGNVRITPSGAVYVTQIIQKPGKPDRPGPWRRVKGQAAQDILNARRKAGSL